LSTGVFLMVRRSGERGEGPRALLRLRLDCVLWGGCFFGGCAGFWRLWGCSLLRLVCLRARGPTSPLLFGEDFRMTGGFCFGEGEFASPRPRFLFSVASCEGRMIVRVLVFLARLCPSSRSGRLRFLLPPSLKTVASPFSFLGLGP